MIDPENAPLIEGKIANYKFQEGILYAYSKPTLRTVELIAENIRLVQEISGGKPVPLLIYLCNSPIPDKATRKYSSEHIKDEYSVMAMVSKPGLSRFIMNILFSLKPPPIPMRSFTDDQEALAWLRSIAE